MVEVELPTGDLVEFPDSMSEDQINQAVLSHLQQEGQLPEDVPSPLPEGAGFGERPATRSDLDRFIADVPAMIGGIAGPLLATRIPAIQQAGPAIQRAAQIAGAGVLGAVGETIQQVGEVITGRDDAPKTGGEIAKNILYAGGEQAAFEGLGQLAMKLGAKALSAAKPTVKELNKSLAKKFGSEGGQFSLPQLTDAWWIHQLEGLSRGSLTGSGVFKRADVANVAAFKEMEDSLVKTITKRATSELSDTEIGNLFVNTVKGGRAAHSNAAGVMYSELDDLVAEKVIKHTLSKAQIPATKEVITPKFFVETGGLKDIANKVKSQLTRTAQVGAGEFDTTLVKRIGEINSNLSFHDAHFLRSNLLSMQRDLSGVVGGGRAKKLIGELVTTLDKSVETAAKSAGDDVFKNFRAVDKFWKRGKETFDNKFIVNLLNADKKAPERIGETIFKTGNVKDILQVKKALKTAGKLDKNLDADLAWQSMQTGHLQSLLGKVSDSEGVVGGNKLLREFIDRRKGRTLSKVYSKEQRDKIIEFADVGRVIQAKPEGGLGMVMNLAQAGVVIDVAQAAATGGARLFDPVEAASILIAPSVIARALTSPKLASMMTKARTTKVATTAGKQLATKLTAELLKLQAEEQE